MSIDRNYDLNTDLLKLFAGFAGGGAVTNIAADTGIILFASSPYFSHDNYCRGGLSITQLHVCKLIHICVTHSPLHRG
jgi:hypothetical protein